MLGVLESEVMESEVMCWNVLLSYLEFVVYLPFVKGTSDEKEGGSERTGEGDGGCFRE